MLLPLEDFLPENDFGNCGCTILSALLTLSPEDASLAGGSNLCSHNAIKDGPGPVIFSDIPALRPAVG